MGAKPSWPSGKEAKILQLLVAHGELYGLDLVKRSDGSLKRGTVYVTLDRMEGKGFVESRQEAAPAHAGGMPRRMYKVTGLGERALRAWEMMGFEPVVMPG